jgi:hypothetical protein
MPENKLRDRILLSLRVAMPLNLVFSDAFWYSFSGLGKADAKKCLAVAAASAGG